MSKIVFTSPFATSGGVAQFVKSLEPFFTQEIIKFKRGSRIKQLKLFRPLMPLIDIVRFTILLIRENPSKVIVNSSLGKLGMFRDGVFIIVSKLFKAKVVLYIHGFQHESVKNKIQLYGYFKADKIFVLASVFKEFLVDYGYNGDIETIYNPIGQEYLSYKPKNENDRITPKKLLFISRIEKNKGIFTVLEVMNILKNENIELNILGSGSALEDAKQMVKERKIKNVNFHGFMAGEDKFDMIKNSDLMVFPTHREGLPIAVLECLAMNVYVLTTKVGGLVDLKKDFIFDYIPDNNPMEIANLIKDYIHKGISYSDLEYNRLLSIQKFFPKYILNKILN